MNIDLLIHRKNQKNMSLSSEDKKHIQLVWDGMGAILENKNEAIVEASFAEDFIQHNPCKMW